ncbi:hypothetical protein AB3S75_028065 [Citrus x aurantiifolia]
MSSSSALVSFFFLLSLVFAIANAQVPANETFKFVNEGGLGEYFNEYNANYRMSGIYNDPFQLGFYSTTPNAFTLALVWVSKSKNRFSVGMGSQPEQTGSRKRRVLFGSRRKSCPGRSRRHCRLAKQHSQQRCRGVRVASKWQHGAS